jgi:pyruvate-formate lyase
MPTTISFTWQARLDALREAKLAANREKQEMTGCLNGDDLAFILPPTDRRKVVEAVSGSGMKIRDCLLDGIAMESNHPNGGFYGPRACGRNFAVLLRNHPPFTDPMSSLAGAYMTNFGSYRRGGWKPELVYAHLVPEQEKYGILSGIGAGQHFCQDLAIGLELGWDGILAKIRRGRETNAPRSADFYDGLEAIALGIQDWISRNAAHARKLADAQPDPAIRANLVEIAAINDRLVHEPPATFREACQWIAWYQMAARMYNGSGSLGRLDMLLTPYYERERAAGTLDDEEAMFHVACLLLRDTAYIQLGGPAPDGRDATNRMSFLVLEAAYRLGVPANIAVCVGRDTDPRLLRRGVEIMFAQRKAMPKFLGIDNWVEGFARNGYPLELARQRAYAGCHWSGIPGREYTLNDCVKINLGLVFDVALRDLLGDAGVQPSTAMLWDRFAVHLRRAVAVTAEGLDFQVEHMHEVFPELVLDLLCHGPIERGIDASHGGVEFMNLCIDASGLATVADSFAAVEQRVDGEHRLAWSDLVPLLDSDWAGPEGERVRQLMRTVTRFGSGGSRADGWARRVSETFSGFVKERPTPAGRNMIPGLFSWANTIGMGAEVGATPNGRHAKAPLSHGANPDPGFRTDGAPTAMAAAIAAVHPRWGNSAPMQIELDPGTARGEEGISRVMALIKAHCDLGGTQVNMNILDRQQVLAAHEDPDRYPDLVVRVTGFSAYFNRLSPDFRQLVVDRIIAES